MKSVIGAMGLGALVLAGCSNQAGTTAVEDSAGSKREGDVEFNLQLPDGSTANSIDLTITCPGFTQTHTVDVSSIVDGTAVAAFGGLPVGSCTVDIVASATDANNNTLACSGSQMFPVTDGGVADVTVPVNCGGGSGMNTDRFGGVKVRTAFSVAQGDCTADLTKKIYAIPAVVGIGSSTTVVAETQNAQGTAAVSFVVDTAGSTGGATTGNQSGNCTPSNNEDCIDVTCTAVGDVYINVGVTDSYTDSTGSTASCTDQEVIWVECVTPSGCGNGQIDPGEACDGQLGLQQGQVCDAVTCQITPTCGNSIVEGSEQCDAGPNGDATCDTNCMLIAPCGNGQLDSGEECDGTLGLQDPTVQTCDPNTCTIVASCGNSIKEGAEVCDGTDGLTDPSTETCAADCMSIQGGGGGGGNVCRDCITNPSGVIATALAGALSACVGDTTGCDRALNCYTESFCANGATVSECYCGRGANPDTCLNGTVAPTGACKDLIVELAGPGLTASDYIIFSTDSNTSVGAAFSLFDIAANNAAANCTNECGTAPVDPTTVGPF